MTILFTPLLIFISLSFKVLENYLSSIPYILNSTVPLLCYHLEKDNFVCAQYRSLNFGFAVV